MTTVQSPTSSPRFDGLYTIENDTVESSGAGGGCRKALDRENTGDAFPLEGAERSKSTAATLVAVADSLVTLLEKVVPALLGEEAAAPSPTGPTLPGGTSPEVSTTPRPLQDRTGFLWKPSSDKNGAAVALLPAWMDEGDVKEVALINRDGTTIEKGTYAGGGNPVSGKDRLHYRFSKPGSAYPEGTKVSLKFSTGAERYIQIPSPDKRYEPQAVSPSPTEELALTGSNVSNPPVVPNETPVPTPVYTQPPVALPSVNTLPMCVPRSATSTDPTEPNSKPDAPALVQQLAGLVSRLVLLVGKVASILLDRISSKAVIPATPAETALPSETGSSSTTETSAGTDLAKAAPAAETTKKLRNLKHDEGFEWLPSKDGLAVVTIPPFFKDSSVRSVVVIGPDGKEIGVAEHAKNKQKNQYRFDKAGSTFPKGVTVKITFDDGRERKVDIKNSSQEYLVPQSNPSTHAQPTPDNR